MRARQIAINEAVSTGELYDRLYWLTHSSVRTREMLSFAAIIVHVTLGVSPTHQTSS